MEKNKLFFLPYAGGSARAYMVMKRLFNTAVFEPVPLELAGRGPRMKESCFTDIKLCVQDLYEQLKPQIKECDYALFGHSLGSILGYELLKYIEEQGEKLPVCAIFSGRVSPSLEIPVPMLSELEDKEFVEKFGVYQALPSEVLNNAQILELVLPVLRADIKMSEQYQYTHRKPANCDIYVLYGKDDVLIDEDGINKWREETAKNSEITSFQGGHFYFKEHTEVFTERINEIMTRYEQ